MSATMQSARVIEVAVGELVYVRTPDGEVSVYVDADCTVLVANRDVVADEGCVRIQLFGRQMKGAQP